jgi:hypothetical protein
MSTLKSTTALSPLEVMKDFGRTQGKGATAKLGACLEFGKLANTGKLGLSNSDSPELLKAKAAEMAQAFADGKKEADSNDVMTADSIKQYTAKFFLFGQSNVYARIDDIQKSVSDFWNAPDSKKAKAKYFDVLSSAASAVRKDSTVKITRELLESICAGKVKAEPTQESKIEQAKAALKSACLALQDLNVLSGDALVAMRESCAALGVSIIPETKAPTTPELPKTAADLQAVVAAAVQAALASLGK